jgi:anthranilate phosphoribosyltransferase
MDFQTYIHAVGTGKKGNRNLSFDEAKDMAMQMLKQKIYSEQIAAFLLGWRLKPETTEEFRGFLSACDELISYHPIKNSLELGYPYDGKVNNPYIFPLVGKMIKDLKLVICGDEPQPAKWGISTKQIFNGIHLDKNIHFFDRADFLPQFYNLNPIRQRLGMRNALNTVEKLLHVAKSPYAITGVFHKPYVKKYIEIFASRYERFGVLQGNEGTPELFSKGRLWLHVDDKTDEFVIDSKRYGITYQKSWQKITLEQSIEMIKSPSDEFIKLAQLNAGIYLFVTNKVKSIDEGFEIANG